MRGLTVGQRLDPPDGAERVNGVADTLRGAMLRRIGLANPSDPCDTRQDGCWGGTGTAPSPPR